MQYVFRYLWAHLLMPALTMLFVLWMCLLCTFSVYFIISLPISGNVTLLLACAIVVSMVFTIVNTMMNLIGYYKNLQAVLTTVAII